MPIQIGTTWAQMWQLLHPLLIGTKSSRVERHCRTWRVGSGRVRIHNRRHFMTGNQRLTHDEVAIGTLKVVVHVRTTDASISHAQANFTHTRLGSRYLLNPNIFLSVNVESLHDVSLSGSTALEEGGDRSHSLRARGPTKPQRSCRRRRRCSGRRRIERLPRTRRPGRRLTPQNLPSALPESVPLPRHQTSDRR